MAPAFAGDSRGRGMRADAGDAGGGRLGFLAVLGMTGGVGVTARRGRDGAAPGEAERGGEAGLLASIVASATVTRPSRSQQ